MITRPPLVRPRALAVWFTLLASSVAAAQPDAQPMPRTRVEPLSHDVEVAVRVYGAEGSTVALWIAPSYGFRRGHAEMAKALAARGLEVWQADIAEALFLPRGSTTMRKLDGTHVANLVERAHSVTGKSVVLVSGSYGAIPVLRGAREWQRREPAGAYLLGAILFSPNLYAQIPSLGLDPAYLPIARATNIPILVFQGGANANRWQLPRLLEVLRSGGSQVFVQLQPDIVGLFYDEERGPAVQREFEALPDNLLRALPLLAQTRAPRTPAPLAQQSAIAPEGKGLDAELKPYRGEPDPPPIRLPDAHGKIHRIDDYRGHVTLVNFWATWCPPCVEEIPSLNRLRTAMNDTPFRLISINYAEGAATIKAFMDEVDVHFPVLIDQEGQVAAQWGVVVFPSTFVIGPTGKIRYGVNAAIRWDAPQVIRQLRALLPDAGAPDP